MDASTTTAQEKKIEITSISGETLDELVRRLVEGMQPEQIILFGSRAYGDSRPESDLDIMVIVPASSEPSHRRDQEAYRCVGAIGISKDLLVLTREEFDAQARVVTSLARRAKEEGIVLYERGNTDRDLEVVGQEPA